MNDDMKSLGLSQEDAQSSRNTWRRNTNGEMGQPRFTRKIGRWNHASVSVVGKSWLKSHMQNL